MAVGLVAPEGIQRLLRRLVGVHRAGQLLIGGEMVAAERAHALGMVDELVPLEQVDARALAWRLQDKAPQGGGDWRAVVAITRGGMVPAMIVARELDIRTIDTISVKSYRKGEQGELQVLKAPDPAMKSGSM